MRLALTLAATMLCSTLLIPRSSKAQRAVQAESRPYELVGDSALSELTRTQIATGTSYELVADSSLSELGGDYSYAFEQVTNKTPPRSRSRRRRGLLL